MLNVWIRFSQIKQKSIFSTFEGGNTLYTRSLATKNFPFFCEMPMANHGENPAGFLFRFMDKMQS